MFSFFSDKKKILNDETLCTENMYVHNDLCKETTWLKPKKPYMIHCYWHSRVKDNFTLEGIHGIEISSTDISEYLSVVLTVCQILSHVRDPLNQQTKTYDKMKLISNVLV